jgi:hypothetical protein
MVITPQCFNNCFIAPNLHVLVFDFLLQTSNDFIFAGINLMVKTSDYIKFSLSVFQFARLVNLANDDSIAYSDIGWLVRVLHFLASILFPQFLQAVSGWTTDPQHLQVLTVINRYMIAPPIYFMRSMQAQPT